MLSALFYKPLVVGWINSFALICRFMLSSSYQKVICWTQEISTWRYVLPYGLNSIPLFPVQKKSEKSTPLIVKFHFILQLTSDGDDDAAASETFLRDPSPALPQQSRTDGVSRLIELVNLLPPNYRSRRRETSPTLTLGRCSSERDLNQAIERLCRMTRVFFSRSWFRIVFFFFLFSKSLPLSNPLASQCPEVRR